MSVTRTFLAWHRTGLAAAVTGGPPAGAGRAAVPAAVRLRGTGRSTVIPIELAGPGDIAGLDPREVRRTEPDDGATDFEPAYFPYVELFSTDLPWRFSPIGPQTRPLPDPEHPTLAPANQMLVPPWLALVVVPAEQAAVTPAAPGGLPSLTCDTDQLPDATETWAWAHVQATTQEQQDPARTLDDPTRAVARLLCPRRLDPGVRYLACIVPTFAAGRAALHGSSPGAQADPLAPAWGPDPRTELPVYFSYSFSTGQPGTFETLARQLRPRSAPASSNGRSLVTDAPGWGIPPATRAPIRMQGALRPLPAGGGHDPAEEPPRDPDLARQLAAAVSTDGTGVQLRPPLYGQDYAGGGTSLPATATGWLSQLNTDPRRRVSAGLGAWAVAVHQEDLSDRAWQQLAAAGFKHRSPGDPDLVAALDATLAGRSGNAAITGVSSVLLRMSRPGGPLSPAGLTALTPRPSDPGGRRVAATAAPAAPGSEVFAPVFEEPVYTYLRAVAPQWLLPGAEDIPTDSIVALRTNPGFVEAFLVGINHAMARELAWRRYPLEPTATMFRRFWSAAPGAADTALPAIVGWPAASDLGAHSSSADQLVVLIRGALLRRFPTAAVYLSGTLPDGGEVHMAPTLAATLGPGSGFFGFPLTPQQALHPQSTGPTEPTSWSVVLQEAVDHARFGCDEAGSGAPHEVKAWQDLGWDHPHLRGRTHIPVAGQLAGLARRLTSGTSPVSVPTATWGLNAGHLAAILQRPAFRVRIPVRLWLQPLLAPPNQ
jgi:hypothetical protein